MTYVDVNTFKSTLNRNDLSDEQISEALIKSVRQIDALTFNRIRAIGFDKLTSFQQEIIKEVVCSHATFLINHQDYLETTLNSYSINGVSISLTSSDNIIRQNGVTMFTSIYETLKQTGLTQRTVW